jgi:hypothetical protein
MSIAKKHPFRLQEGDIFSRGKLVQMYVPILMEQLLLAMRPHPTFEEVLSEALEELVSKLEK